LINVLPKVYRRTYWRAKRKPHYFTDIYSLVCDQNSMVN